MQVCGLSAVWFRLFRQYSEPVCGQDPVSVSEVPAVSGQVCPGPVGSAPVCGSYPCLQWAEANDRMMQAGVSGRVQRAGSRWVCFFLWFPLYLLPRISR